MVQWAEPGRVEIDAPQPLKLTAEQASWFAELVRTASVLSEATAPQSPVVPQFGQNPNRGAKR